ncbi:MAG: hypothetical protein JWP59_798, partial [Massilia sp.]|nr:hypothetical protein [Massilia sp.]
GMLIDGAGYQATYGLPALILLLAAGLAAAAGRARSGMVNSVNADCTMQLD